VAGLKKEDFKLLDNGKEQRMTTFNVDTAETLRTGPVAATVETKVDNSNSGNAVGTSEALLQMHRKKQKPVPLPEIWKPLQRQCRSVLWHECSTIFI
jgi:hypothetical protein